MPCWRKLFGNEADLVRREFLTVTGGGNYSLKPEFATQRQVENYFAAQPQSERAAKLKTGLFDLISNVILLEAEGKFHFRFAMEQTLSFKNLPPDRQAKLRELYVDYFFRRQDDFWMREAMQKLPALKRVTDMLICGEDLGLVPACVPGVMKELGLVEPRNPADAQGARRGIFPAGGRAVFKRGDALDARHEHHPRLVDGRPRADAKILQSRAGPARRSPGGGDTGNRRGRRPAASGVAGDVEHFSMAGFAGPGWRTAARRRGCRTHQRAGRSEFLLALPAAPAAGETAGGGTIQSATGAPAARKRTMSGTMQFNQVAQPSRLHQSASRRLARAHDRQTKSRSFRALDVSGGTPNTARGTRVPPPKDFTFRRFAGILFARCGFKRVLPIALCLI